MSTHASPSARFPEGRQRLLLNAFLMNTPSHITGGTWRHPDAQQHRYNELPFWIDVAKRLEEAKFDALFFADVVGLYGDDSGGWASHVRRGMQVPANDPLVLVSALAASTSDIGLAITSSVAQNHPFNFARQLSTLDHLSGGRVGWNIVTSRLDNTHRNFGAPGLVPHAERYEWAAEYVDVVFKLWEGSWDEGAVLADKESYVFADPDKVHKIYHESPRYRVDGPHLVSPSPQRTPVLFQAGSSTEGRGFGAENGEAIFVMLSSPAEAAEFTADVRARAVAAGRDADDIRFVQGATVIVGATEEDAQRRAAEVGEYLDPRARLAHIGGMLGIDLGGLPLDTPLGDFDSEGARSFLENLQRRYPDRRPTLREILDQRASGWIVGTPEQVADELERWQDAGIDGFNFINALLPGTYDDLIDGLIPELRRRGLAQSEYAPGTLREKLFGRGAHLDERHPASRYRGAFEQFSATALNTELVVTPA